MKQGASEDYSLGLKLLTAGTAACIADLATFPLDTAKVRMQVSKIIHSIRLYPPRVTKFRRVYYSSVVESMSHMLEIFQRLQEKVKPCCWHRRKGRCSQ